MLACRNFTLSGPDLGLGWHEILPPHLCGSLGVNMSCAATHLLSVDPLVPEGDDVSADSLFWLWQTVGATVCWAISDVVCDTCIESGGGDDALEPHDLKEVRAGISSITGLSAHGKPESRLTPPASPTLRGRCRGAPLLPPQLELPPASASGPLASPASSARVRSRQLSPEQNALVSGLVALLTVAAVLSLRAGAGCENVKPSLYMDAKGAMAMLGGCFHFTAYLSTLRAFGSASSTVITPLMQLSALWMLPFSTMASLLGFATMIQPWHLVAVLLIVGGGLLPAAGGSLAPFLSLRFWRQPAVRYVLLGEFLICCYNVILHQATYLGGDVVGEQDGITMADDLVCNDVMRFFLLSRVANGLTCLCMFVLVPSLRLHACGIRNVAPQFLSVSFLGECLSMIGVCLVTFSYSSFYEPSVVNAAEGGLQQLFNLLFAIVSYRVLGWGRKVEQVSVKLVSFLMVAIGLMLSTT